MCEELASVSILQSKTGRTKESNGGEVSLESRSVSCMTGSRAEGVLERESVPFLFRPLEKTYSQIMYFGG
jgi:hypothetical protein